MKCNDLLKELGLVRLEETDGRGEVGVFIQGERSDCSLCLQRIKPNRGYCKES